MRILNSNASYLCNGNAFTLLEVIVAIAILAISLTTLFSSQSRNISLATEAKFKTNASLLAGLKLAEVESGKIQPVDSEGDFGDDFPGYTWKMEVGDVSAESFEWSDIIDKRMVRVDISVLQQQDAMAYTIRCYVRRETHQ